MNELAKVAGGNGLRDLVEFVADRNEVDTVDIGKTAAGQPLEILGIPAGMKVESLKKYLDEYLLAPERKKGTAVLTSIASFVEHVNRFKDGESAVFAWDERESPSLTAVLNYHSAGDGGARFGDHRSFYEFPLSDEWRAWHEIVGEKLKQDDFAEFIENRIADVMEPPASLTTLTESDAGGDFGSKTPDEQLADLLRKIGGACATPNRLMALARGLKVRVDERVTTAVTLSSGEGEMSFSTEHKDADGAPLRIPNLFLIQIPVFQSGPLYRLAVRLRYRVAAGAVVWFLELYRDDKVFDHAFNEACALVAKETALPLFRGRAEA